MFFKYVDYLIIGLLLLSFNMSNSMNSFIEFHNEAVKKFDRSTVLGVVNHGPLAHVMLLKEQENIVEEAEDIEKPHCQTFFLNWFNTIPYLTPIVNSGQLTQLSKDYKLLHAATNGNLDSFIRALQHGADINTTDQRYYPLMFTIHKMDGTICTDNDINNMTLMHLEHHKKPTLNPAPYMFDTKNYNAYQLASYYKNFNIIRELVARYPNTISPEDKTNIQEAVAKLEADEQKLQRALQLSEIPYFNIEPRILLDDNPDHFTEDDFYIWSCNDDNISLESRITKDKVILQANTPMHTWKHPYLDLDALATVYSHIICKNNSEGKKLVDSFNQWKGHAQFTDRILQYINDFIESQSFREDHLLSENLVELARHLVSSNQTTNRIIEKYLALLLSLCASKVHEEEYARSCNTLLPILLQKKEIRDWLRSLCDDSYNKALLPHLCVAVRSFTQTILMRFFLAKQLSHANPRLPIEVAHLVAAYWQPDDHYKNYFKSA